MTTAQRSGEKEAIMAIRYESSADITTHIDEAIALSKEAGEEVTFHFNGMDFFVNPDSNPQELYELYKAAFLGVIPGRITTETRITKKIRREVRRAEIASDKIWRRRQKRGERREKRLVSSRSRAQFCARLEKIAKQIRLNNESVLDTTFRVDPVRQWVDEGVKYLIRKGYSAEAYWERADRDGTNGVLIKIRPEPPVPVGYGYTCCAACGW